MYHISDLHIELTDKCQASCPMCGRNKNGGAERPFVGQHEITLDKFKLWFSSDWLAQLDNFYACGNYGDPIIAQDCLEIFEYVRQVNPTARLSIHTNGSARPITWWQRLAKLNIEVSFGIDGFAESHVKYRRGTDWYKITANMQAFIQAGGVAVVDCLVFKHNEHEVSKFHSVMTDMGVSKVNFKYTSRFYDMPSFPVEDKEGNIEYSLYPSTEKRVAIIRLEDIKRDINVWKEQVLKADIKPKCERKKEIYIDARGNVYPCCWVGFDWLETPLEEKLTVHSLRNQMIEDTKQKFQGVGIFNLDSTIIEELAWHNLEKVWHGPEKAWVCVKNCNG